MRARERIGSAPAVAAIYFSLLALPATAAAAEQLTLRVAMSHPVVKAGEKLTAFLKIGLTGFRSARESDRAPVNLALVIDTSSSMQGEKIGKAREAAIMVIQRLNRNDIVSVVEYNSSVRVVVPATKLTDPELVCSAIRQLETRTNTALFAGVTKGAEEVRKFLSRDRVNRVILISDGLANVGPSSPDELGDLGASLIREGVSVTTIGLGDGYNEDLMHRLARRSDGNHYFAENSGDLARIFRGEIGDILTVAAQEVQVTIQCADGFRPVRMLGRDAEITGQKVVSSLNQVYCDQEKYFILEVEMPAAPPSDVRLVATVDASYANLVTRTSESLKSSATARFTDSAEAVERELNKDVMAAAVEQLANITSKLAMKLRDEGKIEEARRLIISNVGYLNKNAVELKSDSLRRYAESQSQSEKSLDSRDYPRARKIMVEDQARKESQQKEVGSSSSPK